MKYTQRLFIYDRREMVVLVLLIFMVTVFTFTLGVHLGKRVGTKVLAVGTENTSTISTLPDQVPNRLELTEQGKGAEQALEDTLNTELKHEVTQTGVHLEIPRQINLPEKPKTGPAGATSLEKKPQETPVSQSLPQTEKNKKTERYTLQIGSYPTLDEAKKQLASLNQTELKPFWREAEIKGKGKWYRLYAGSFSSRDAAEHAGVSYRSRHMITSFIVSKITE